MRPTIVDDDHRRIHVYSCGYRLGRCWVVPLSVPGAFLGSNVYKGPFRTGIPFGWLWSTADACTGNSNVNQIECWVAFRIIYRLAGLFIICAPNGEYLPF